MPRIDAPTVREHIQRQTDAILDAGARLVAERGLRNVELGDIATAVGLKRTSLYRYFPNKEAIVAAWFARELPVATARGVAVLDAPGTPGERVGAWLDLQVALTAEESHRLAVRLVRESGGLQGKARESMVEGHRDLYSRVTPLLAELVGEAEAPTAMHLIGGLVRAAGEAVEAGREPVEIAAALRRAAAGLLRDETIGLAPPAENEDDPVPAG